MQILKPIVAALAITAIAGPAFADAKIYPYHSKENYCPYGLQPITISGVISCGSPNQSQSYKQVMQHPTPKKRLHVYKPRRSSNCAEGEKGCF
ncbi:MULTISPECIES: hypothetical protein [unclassified Roseovarius]|uniref:hypothetical protein n=1 Tax=unclassified Roseovarius TaxID=2614913 RepID=UPI00273F9F92|nr:hypothetical protein [Roseovarius sp. MMSF_3350]